MVWRNTSLRVIRKVLIISNKLGKHLSDATLFFCPNCKANFATESRAYDHIQKKCKPTAPLLVLFRYFFSIALQVYEFTRSMFSLDPRLRENRKRLVNQAFLNCELRSYFQISYSGTKSEVKGALRQLVTPPKKDNSAQIPTSQLLPLRVEEEVATEFSTSTSNSESLVKRNSAFSHTFVVYCSRRK